MDYKITTRQKDKGWQYIISVKQNGKWKQVKSKQGFEGQRIAKKAAELLWEEIKDNYKEIVVTEPGKTFEDFSMAFLSHQTLYKERNTIVSYESMLTHFESIKSIFMENLTVDDLQACVDKMIKHGISWSTMSMYKTKLKTMFKYAKGKYRTLSVDAINDIILPKQTKIKEKTALSSFQIKEFMSDLLNMNLDPALILISKIALKCGLRYGEIMGLKWLDLDRCTLKIDRQIKKISNKEYGEGKLKSSNSYRTIPISKKFEKELLLYNKSNPIQLNGFIFDITKYKSYHISINVKFKKTRYPISVHDLRHTYATTLISNGIDFKTAAKLLGHSVEQTLRTYSHVNDDMMKRAENFIENNF